MATLRRRTLAVQFQHPVPDGQARECWAEDCAGSDCLCDHALVLVISHIAKWKQSYFLGKQYQQKYSDSYVTVRYEDLVLHPEMVTREVCDVISLKFKPEMLRMEEHLGWRGDNSFFADTREDDTTISSKPIGRYRKHLSKYHLHLYQRLLKDELDDAGYRIHKLPPYQRIWFHSKFRCHQVFRTLSKIAMTSLRSVKGRMRHALRLLRQLIS